MFGEILDQCAVVLETVEAPKDPLPAGQAAGLALQSFFVWISRCMPARPKEKQDAAAGCMRADRHPICAAATSQLSI